MSNKEEQENLSLEKQKEVRDYLTENIKGTKKTLVNGTTTYSLHVDGYRKLAEEHGLTKDVLERLSSFNDAIIGGSALFLEDRFVEEAGKKPKREDWTKKVSVVNLSSPDGLQTVRFNPHQTYSEIKDKSVTYDKYGKIDFNVVGKRFVPKEVQYIAERTKKLFEGK